MTLPLAHSTIFGCPPHRAVRGRDGTVPRHIAYNAKTSRPRDKSRRVPTQRYEGCYALWSRRDAHKLMRLVALASWKIARPHWIHHPLASNSRFYFSLDIDCTAFVESPLSKR